MKRLNSKSRTRNIPDMVCHPNNYFGQSLREIRLEKKLTQISAAKRLNITQAQWSAYEVGKSRPTLDMIILIAMKLKVSPFELINRSLEQSKLIKKSPMRGKDMGEAKTVSPKKLTKSVTAT